MNACTHRIAEEYGTDLSNRHRASLLRQSIFDTIESGCDYVVIDLSGVRTLSDSYADELFAVMVASQGAEWFRQHIRIVSANEGVRWTILESIDQRLDPK